METIESITDTNKGFLIVTSEQSISLEMDMESQCCERFGYFFSNDVLSEFIGATVSEIRLVDTELNSKKLVEERITRGDCMFVNIITDRGILQFTAYNEHNGYYGHYVKITSKTFQHEGTI